MAKRLDDFMTENYKVGDSIDLARGRTGTIKEVHFNEKGKISELVVLDNKNKKHVVPIQTKYDVRRKK